MPSVTPCPCLLCGTEANLLRAVHFAEREIVDGLFSRSLHLNRFPSVSSLIRYLRTSSSNPEIDQLLGELCALRKAHSEMIESLMVLVFLPMLHATVRRVTEAQPALAVEDVSQQVLHVLLQYLSSEDLERRRSHFAFAISRAVKRKTFEWAYRESLIASMDGLRNCDALELVVTQEALERHATLRHFLHKALANRLLTDKELDLLIEFKLEGNGGSEFEASGRGNSNILRQRLKRLLAKLRRIANAKKIQPPAPIIGESLTGECKSR
jgi:hypothetical protein